MDFTTFAEFTEADIKSCEDLQEVIDVLEYNLKTQPSLDVHFAWQVHRVIKMLEKESIQRACDSFYRRKGAMV